jgi:glucosamine-6-phosphate deaminase
MKVCVFETEAELGRSAAAAGAEAIERALADRGQAAIILATGASQFAMLDNLVNEERIDWARVEAFHLDEYIGLSISHGASFRRYLKERFEQRLPVPIGRFHYIVGEAEPAAECQRLGSLLSAASIDVAFVGIGENGHLAFNDPPADFEIEAPYIVVDLDRACRAQQVGEGWFADIDAVPRQAISMSIQQIMKSRTIICTVPEARKAEAVQKVLEGPVTPDVPASILQRHPDCHMMLDQDSRGLTKKG